MSLVVFHKKTQRKVAKTNETTDCILIGTNCGV